MPVARAGEVWTIDLGMVAKVRPCLLLTDWPADDELALITVLAHTTSLRGGPWELAIRKSFLSSGAFHLQQIHSVPTVKLERRLGLLTEAEMNQVLDKLLERLRL